MGNHISNLPLQDMIAGVVRSATEKLAADEEVEKKVKDEIKGESVTDEDKEMARKEVQRRGSIPLQS